MGMSYQTLFVRFSTHQLGDQLSFYSIPEGNPENFYKVPFTDALDLVQSRQVVIKSVSLP